MIVDPSPDSDPVTANFSWTALDNATFGDQNITYTVIVTYENDIAVAGQSTSHPNSSLEISDLPACANLTATLVAERNNESCMLYIILQGRPQSECQLWTPHQILHLAVETS